jgi:hypothetical protein
MPALPAGPVRCTGLAGVTRLLQPLGAPARAGAQGVPR